MTLTGDGGGTVDDDARMMNVPNTWEPLLAARVGLSLGGIDVESGGMQSERTIFLMRLFDAGIPMVTSAIAIWAVARFPITEEKAREVREELEQRRGRA